MKYRDTWITVLIAAVSLTAGMLTDSLEIVAASFSVLALAMVVKKAEDLYREVEDLF